MAVEYYACQTLAPRKRAFADARNASGNRHAGDARAAVKCRISYPPRAWWNHDGSRQPSAFVKRLRPYAANASQVQRARERLYAADGPAVHQRHPRDARRIEHRIGASLERATFDARHV